MPLKTPRFRSSAPYRLQPCITSKRMPVPMSETKMEPMQPRRLEKNANIDKCP